MTKEFVAKICWDITVEEAPPRHNLWMNCEKARKLGVDFSTVEDGLRACARDYDLVK